MKMKTNQRILDFMQVLLRFDAFGLIHCIATFYSLSNESNQRSQTSTKLT